MQNPFVWHDLMASDVTGAKRFYSAVLAWSFADPMMEYHIANVGEAGIGGIMAAPEHLKTMPPSSFRSVGKMWVA